jgi:hypothetical protein
VRHSTTGRQTYARRGGPLSASNNPTNLLLSDQPQPAEPVELPIRGSQKRPAQTSKPLRDVQEAAWHADPRTTMRYDRARVSLDRRATYIISAFIAGGSR